MQGKKGSKDISLLEKQEKTRSPLFFGLYVD